MLVLSGRTADDVWCAAAAQFTNDGRAQRQPGRGGATVELLHVGMTISDPRQRWVISRTPALNPAFALVEVLWIASGRRDAALPLHWNPRLSRFCGDDQEYHGAYGYRLRSHFGLDQLERVYEVLQAVPDTRQAVLQIWDASADLPDREGVPASADIPCNVVAFPKVRNGRLEWMQVLRSNDLFLGVPHNVVQFTALQEIIAGWLGVELGEYTQVSDSLHVYVRDLEAVRATVAAPDLPANTDSLALDRESWEQIVPNIMARLEGMMLPDLLPQTMASLALTSDAPLAYENIVLVAAADSSRRRGWEDLSQACIDAVTNPILVAMWNRWSARVSAGRATGAPQP